MTVGEMCAQMSNDEYLHWSIYYQRVAQRAELRALQQRGS